jgi:hypothetical protein
MVCPDGAEFSDATLFEPAEEAAHGDGIGCARVGVADIGAVKKSMKRSAAASPRSATIPARPSSPVPAR